MLDLFSISQIIRYGYTGFLIAGIAVVLKPSEMKPAVEAAGDVVAPLIVFAVGAAVYVLYRYVLGELLLYPFSHLVHFVIDSLMNAQKASSPTGFLRELHVPFGQRRDAYTALRRHFFDDDQRKRLDLAHSEVHVLFLTCVIFLVTAIVVPSMSQTPKYAAPICTAIAAAFGLSAFVHDFRLHCNEYRLLATKRNEVIEFLKKFGYPAA